MVENSSLHFVMIVNHSLKELQVQGLVWMDKGCRQVTSLSSIPPSREEQPKILWIKNFDTVKKLQEAKNRRTPVSLLSLRQDH